MTTAPTTRLNTGDEMPVLGSGAWRLSGDGCVDAVRWALGRGLPAPRQRRDVRQEEAVGAAIEVSGVPRETLVTTKLSGGDHGRVADAARGSVQRLGLEHVRWR